MSMSSLAYIAAHMKTGLTSTEQYKNRSKLAQLIHRDSEACYIISEDKTLCSEVASPYTHNNK